MVVCITEKVKSGYEVNNSYGMVVYQGVTIYIERDFLYDL